MKPIRDHADYEKALARIEEPISAPEGSPEVGELEVLAILVEKYEKEHYPIPEAPMSEALKLFMKRTIYPQRHGQISWGSEPDS